uniref:Secreted protein n=1 Tax=Amblyomma triste TaxID=251400 RepID=A0A023G4U4_AMBTT
MGNCPVLSYSLFSSLIVLHALFDKGVCDNLWSDNLSYTAVFHIPALCFDTYQECIGYNLGFCNAVSFPFGMCLHLCAAQSLFVAPFYSGEVTHKLFVTFAVMCSVPIFVCVRVLVCKRNLSLEHHPIAKFLEAAKAKSANF